MMRAHRTSGLMVLVIAALVAAFGCGDDAAYETSHHPGGSFGSSSASGGGGGGNYGATPGGAQDINYARTLIAEGQVPQASAITVEGLISEHDIESSGPECDDLLCMRPAIGVAPSLETGEMEMWVQLGMVSGFREGQFSRPPMDIVVLIDKSSAMEIDMDETNASANAMIDQLRDDDKVSVVTFDSNASLLQEEARLGDIDRAALKRRVEDIDAGGAANMEAGLTMAYDVARRMDSGPDRMTRVILLSCGYPAAGSSSSFSTLVEDGAADGIGLTFFGVLLNFHDDLANEMSQARGGNYFYSNDLAAMIELFEEEFEFMVTPLAYDLKVDLQVDTDHYEIDGLYGIPGDPGAAQAGFEVSTAFISKRGGAMVARLRPTGDETPKHVAQVDFSYEPETAHGFSQAHDSSEGIRHDGELSESYFDSDGVRKSVALVNMAEQLARALEQYHSGAAGQATQTLEELRDYLQAEADALDDDALRAEVALIDTLIDNI
jgi:Ca-activated chloride channel homolog